MYKTSFAFLLFLVFSLCLKAQETNDNYTRMQKGEDLNFLYRNERSGSLFIHSAGGFGIGFRRGQNMSGLSKKMYEIECANFKSRKEIKSVESYFLAGVSGYVYGKVNSVLLFRGGVGLKNTISRRVDKRNVEINYIAFTGLTLAFAKPVYLFITDTSGKSSKVIARYDPITHNQDNIIGKANFSNGLGQTKILPAGYVKLGLNFDYAEEYDLVRALEVGVNMDVYPKAVQLMANTKNRNVLFSIYLKMMWGTKWF